MGLEDTQGLGDICIEIKDFIREAEKPYSIDYKLKPNGRFEENYDP